MFKLIFPRGSNAQAVSSGHELKPGKKKYSIKYNNKHSIPSEESFQLLNGWGN